MREMGFDKRNSWSLWGGKGHGGEYARWAGVNIKRGVYRRGGENFTDCEGPPDDHIKHRGRL